MQLIIYHFEFGVVEMKCNYKIYRLISTLCEMLAPPHDMMINCQFCLATMQNMIPVRPIRTERVE